MRYRKRLIILISVLFGSNFVHGKIDTVKYALVIQKPYFEAIDSYPQKIVKSEEKLSENAFYIEITTFNSKQDSVKRKIAKTDIFDPDYEYDKDIKSFLEPTELIDCNNPKIITIADTLLGNETNTLKIIKKALRFSKQYITFDDSIARAIEQDKCKTLDIQTILDKRKGTCSEYTNLFIALMRRKAIPTRFVAGLIYQPANDYQGEHAWAECYVKNYGWLSVDPQNAFIFLPPSAIKLVYGKDFLDCKINSFKELIPLRVENVNAKRK